MSEPQCECNCRVTLGDIERLAPDVLRVGEMISYNGDIYIREPRANR